MNKESIDYTSEEFWKTAPEGYDYYVVGINNCTDVPSDFHTLKFRGYFDRNGLYWDIEELNKSFVVYERPTTFTKPVQEGPVSNTDWDGTGVPAAGSEFEYNLDSDSPDDWYKGQARYSFDRGVVAMCFVGDRSFEQYLDKDTVQFRPIKKEPTIQEKILEAWKAQGIDFAYDNEDTTFSFKVLIDFVVNNFDVKEKE